IDHAVAPAPMRGGMRAAGDRLAAFVRDDLASYHDKQHPDDDHTSRLSPYLHWGHVSAHEVAMAVLERADWTPDRLGTRVDGAGGSGCWSGAPTRARR